MRLVFLHEAEQEFWESVEYYERKEPGLGVRFKDEVDQHLEKVMAQPLLAAVRRSRYRRVNLSTFRHYIAYVIRGDILWILAISHSHRKPEFWSGRLKGL